MPMAADYIEGIGKMDYLSDVSELFKLDAENILMLKFSYLLNI